MSTREPLQNKPDAAVAPHFASARAGALQRQRPGGERPAPTDASPAPRIGHDFSRIRLRAPDQSTAELPHPRAGRSAAISADRAETPLGGENAPPPGVDLAQGTPPKAAPAAPATGTPAAPPAPAAPCVQVDTFTASNDTYTDTATDCKKNIDFNCTVKAGSDPHKCVLVNWVQGTAKNKDGSFRKVNMFNKTVDYNFPSSRIDSLDTDPVYWSTSSGRWNYNMSAPAAGSGSGAATTFSASDSPGPTVWEDGIDYDLKFNMCTYCIDDVSPTSDEKGSGVKNPQKCVAWVFKAKYDAAAHKFSH